MPIRPIPRSRTPRPGRPAGRFTQHRRIDLLREKLETHTAGLTLQELAMMLRITTRSVRRYLRELALVTELESIAVRPGAVHLWRIKPSERGRTVALRRTQAYAILAARRVFEVLKGSALFDEVDVLFREVAQVARRPATRSAVRGEVGDARLEDRFAYIPPVARAYGNRTEDVDELFRGVSELRVLRFGYRDDDPHNQEGPGPKNTKGRGERDGLTVRMTAHPYALVLHGGIITCVGRDEERGVVRALPFDRMSGLEASEGERFDLPSEFDLADWLQGDFGVASSPRNLKVLVEFDPRVADGVRARRVHPSQKLAVAADGRVRASLLVPDTHEVVERLRTWLLGFGAAARVVEPRELADDIARELKRAADRYGAVTGRP